MDSPDAKTKALTEQIPYSQHEGIDPERELSGLAAAYRIIFSEFTEQSEEHPNLPPNKA